MGEERPGRMRTGRTFTYWFSCGLEGEMCVCSVETKDGRVYVFADRENQSPEGYVVRHICSGDEQSISQTNSNGI